MMFQKDKKNYEIDLEVMDRLAELQEAVIGLMEDAGKDTSAISASLAAWKERAAQTAVTLAVEETAEEAYAAALSSGLKEAEALQVAEEVRTAMLSSVSSGTEVSSAAEAALAVSKLSISALSASISAADSLTAEEH